MKIRSIETIRRVFGSDAEKYSLRIRIYLSQEELDTLKEKGIQSLLGGSS